MKKSVPYSTGKYNISRKTIAYSTTASVWCRVISLMQEVSEQSPTYTVLANSNVPEIEAYIQLRLHLHAEYGQFDEFGEPINERMKWFHRCTKCGET